MSLRTNHFRKWFYVAFALALFAFQVPARADVQMEAAYSQPANLFSLMDNVSGWLPEFTEAAYRDEWTRRFGWSKSDQAWADRYSEYRHRTYSDPSQGRLPAISPDGLFASSEANTAESDLLAAYFMSEDSLPRTLSRFRTVATAPDAEMLKGFYRHFEPKWRSILAESAPLVVKAELLNRQLHAPGAIAFVSGAARFYRVSIDGTFKSFFVWFPPGRRSSAEVVAGRYFLIHVPPGQASTDDWDETAMHELMHYMSAHQSPEQKQALTKKFLARCPEANRPKALRLLEEPLAVAMGQATYAKYGKGHPLNWKQSWYAIPQVDVLGHLLSPTVDQVYTTGETITDGVVEAAAKQCAVLFGAVNALSGSQ